MTVVAVDDTDSRTRGMCTTYLGALLAERLDATRAALVRLAPGVDHKTRGNAAVAVHTDAGAARAAAAAREVVERHAVTADSRTSPGVAVAGYAADAVPPELTRFTTDAVRSVVSFDRAHRVARAADLRTIGWGDTRRVETKPDGTRRVHSLDADSTVADAPDETNEESGDAIGRGRIGAVAAVGAWRAFADRTHERLVYRLPERRGTPREVDESSVFAAANEAYPDAWDTVDRVEREAVCVPNTPGPVLFGIRGDDPTTVERVAAAIDHEPSERAATFVTNQGTDAHLADGRIGETTNGQAYRLPAIVVDGPETREGGHVFCTVSPPEAVESRVDAMTPERIDEEGTERVADGRSDPLAVPEPRVTDGAETIDLAAFEPTKRFRDRVRALRVGDRVTACGEVSDGTCKLEKIAVRGLVRTEATTPICPDCGRSMGSAGRRQGYRCRDCGTRAGGRVRQPIDRSAERGWYEVPPVARRHVAKPLVRGGFDAPTHPER